MIASGTLGVCHPQYLLPRTGQARSSAVPASYEHTSALSAMHRQGDKSAERLAGGRENRPRLGASIMMCRLIAFASPIGSPYYAMWVSAPS